MADDKPEDATDQPDATDGDLGQDAIDALLAGGPASLGQDEIDALLSGGTDEPADDEAALPVDESSDESLLDDDGAEPEPAAADPDASLGAIDQDTLDQLWAQALAESSTDSAAAEPVYAAEEGDDALMAALPDFSAAAAAFSKGSAADALRTGPRAQNVGDLDLLAEVVLTVSAEIGRMDITIQDLLKLGPGSLIELDKLVGEPVELLINDRCIARGEVVVVADNFGVRITELGRQS